jgi:hypothetical protein
MTETPPPFGPDRFTSATRVVSVASFDMARLARDTMAMVNANWLLVVLLSFCLVALPKLAVVATHLSFHGRLSDEDSAYDILNNIDNVLDWVTLNILQFVLCWALVRLRAGEDLALDSFAALVFPLVLVAILTSIGTILGFVVFVIPGLILVARWSVAWTVVVSEGKSPLGAMGRSATLARGYSWQIFVVVILGMIFQYVWALGVSFVGDAMLGIWPDHHIDWIIEGLGAPWGALPLSVAYIALYFHLVALKEGSADMDIAEAFD